MLLGALLLIVASAFNIWYGLRVHQPAFIAIGVVGIVFFGVCAAFGVALSLRRQPLVEINKSGIVDRSSAVGAGPISWDEITGAEIRSTMSNKYLVIFVARPEEVILRQSPIKQKLMRMNVPIVGSPVAIAGTLLTMPIEELRSHILEWLDQTGKADNGQQS